MKFCGLHQHVIGSPPVYSLHWPFALADSAGSAKMWKSSGWRSEKSSGFGGPARVHTNFFRFFWVCQIVKRQRGSGGVHVDLADFCPFYYNAKIWGPFFVAYTHAGYIFPTVPLAQLAGARGQIIATILIHVAFKQAAKPSIRVNLQTRYRINLPTPRSRD